MRLPPTNILRRRQSAAIAADEDLDGAIALAQRDRMPLAVIGRVGGLRRGGVLIAPREQRGDRGERRGLRRAA